jgi:hypothetical protein
MDPLIIAGALAGVPILLALVFRVSAVFVFLSVAAGGLLVNVVGDDASLAAGMWVRNNQHTQMITSFALLLVPVALTLLFMRKTLPRSKFLLHLIPLAATGLALTVLALPILPSGMEQQLFSNRYGDMLKDAQDVIVAAAAVLTLALAWATYRHKEEKASKHGKH